ncbi:hypothetical protein [Thermoanaerobacterium butyriciformans]|uniref:Uncharacterized protein n=1 Tax=Thermoanaerobacterium butyriciformans TaxID=1702242 RepID=A0ABS4NAT1_9THEO|nr:hypothetical protein [Thermoanaerobacterium butyriciformans]MBP2070772.1 hypothetical protein [Thermoanaerobacterium butyriciformans]
MSNKVIKKIRVRCSGHLHEIGLNQKGQLIFFNHTKAEIKAEQALFELGAEPCGCLKFLYKWRKKQVKRKELKDEIEEMKSKHTARIVNNIVNQRIRIINLQNIKKYGHIKEFQKLYMERQMNLSIKLAKRTLRRQKAQIMHTNIYTHYDYLLRPVFDIEIAFAYLNNVFSVLLHHDWWKIYKNFKGGVIKNKLITSVEAHTEIRENICLVLATDFTAKNKTYGIEFKKNNNEWQIVKEELL